MTDKNLLEIIAKLNEKLIANEYAKENTDDPEELEYRKRYEGVGLSVARAWSGRPELNAIMREMMEEMKENKKQ